jgi:hypothetical protein
MKINGGRNTCAAGTRRGVALARQVSRAQCRRGKSWGYNNRMVWVDCGCRADFVFRKEVARPEGLEPPT